MKSNLSIQLKAFILLLVFASNTVIGLACAMGMDMRYNRSHCVAGANVEMPCHGKDKTHKRHPQPPTHHHKENNKESRERGECCNDIVLKFSQTDKTAPQSPGIVVNPLSFTSFAADYYLIDIKYSSQIAGIVKYFVRNYHPPIPDIRISIQSFQI